MLMRLVVAAAGLLLAGTAKTAAAAGWRPPVYNTSATCCAPDKLNVHLVCHTHDDVGWLKTIDQYYLGANNTIQHAGVQYILDTVVDALLSDERRKFTYVEQAFFSRWWGEQTLGRRAQVRRLVKEGRLVFTNGGWCMHDEASAHYVGMIDQTTLGHRFISEVFGESALPRVGWQIDPFGHSATQASLLSGAVGFEALYFGRIDYQDMAVRKERQRLEFLWDASPSLGPESAVFTGVFPSGNYGPPPGFCFDMYCNDMEPLNDDPRIVGENIERRVDEFVARVKELAEFFPGNNIMLQMGSDFNYENAQMWYANLDKLIHYANEDGRLHVFYSTPIEYTEARQQEGLAFTTKRDDFFPYADGPHMYWTGYFTSRPSLKRLERQTSGYLQTARQLEALASLLPPSSSSMDTNAKGKVEASLVDTDTTEEEEEVSLFASGLFPLEEALAVVQHHDGVSGTAKQHVAYDYAMRLDKGYTLAQHVAAESVLQLLTHGSHASSSSQRNNLTTGTGPAHLLLRQCKLLNESTCEPTQHATEAGKDLLVLVFNPLAHERPPSPIRLPVAHPRLRVYSIAAPFTTLPADVLENSPAGNNKTTQYTLVFQTKRLPPLGLDGYIIRTHDDDDDDNTNNKKPHHSHHHHRALLSADTRDQSKEEEDVVVVENAHVSLSFNSTTGRLASITRYGTGSNGANLTLPVAHDLLWYASYNGSVPLSFEKGPRDENQPGGAYILRPDPNTTDAVPINPGPIKLEVVKGTVVTEVRQVFAEWASLIYCLHNDDSTVEMEWSVGPIPIDDNIGKEIISRFSTGIHNFLPASSTNKSAATTAAAGGQGGEGAATTVLYTDANGREFQKRLLNHRLTWNASVDEPVAGNYYPVNAAAYIHDQHAQLAVIVDRSQGVASLAPGQLELLIQRRLLVDDGRGVGEPLNETSVGIEHGTWERRGDGVVVKGIHRFLLSEGRSAEDDTDTDNTSSDSSSASTSHVNEGIRDVRREMDLAFLPPALFFATAPALLEAAATAFSPSTGVGSDAASLSSSFLKVGELPPQIHLLTLQKLPPRPSSTCARVLLRLAHQYAVGEDTAELSQPATVNLRGLFPRHKVVGVTELTLSASQPKANLRRLPWTTTTGATLAGSVLAGHTPLQPLAANDTDCLRRPLMVELGPMEIRTFEVALSSSSVEGEADADAAVNALVVGRGEGKEEGALLMME